MIVSVLANQVRTGPLGHDLRHCMRKRQRKRKRARERGLMWTYTAFGEKMKQKCLRVMMSPSAKIPVGLIK